MLKIRNRDNAGRTLRMIGSALVLAILAGCVVIPTNYYENGSRRNINHETHSLLKPGVSTKEDVFLLLGEPDYVSENGLQLGYAWSKITWMLVAIGGGIEGGKTYLLLISFDSTGRMKAWEIMDTSGYSSTPEEILDSEVK